MNHHHHHEDTHIKDHDSSSEKEKLGKLSNIGLSTMKIMRKPTLNGQRRQI